MEGEEDFGRQLREFRVARHYSLRELARRVGGGAGKDATYLSRLEKGTYRPPKIETIHSLARALALNSAEEAALLRASGHLPSTLQVAPVTDSADHARRGWAAETTLTPDISRLEASWKGRHGELVERLAPAGAPPPHDFARQEDVSWGASEALAHVLTDKGGSWSEDRVSRWPVKGAALDTSLSRAHHLPELKAKEQTETR